MIFRLDYPFVIFADNDEIEWLVNRLIDERYIRHHVREVFTEYASDKFDATSLDIIADLIIDGAYNDIFMLPSISSMFTTKEIAFLSLELYQLNASDILAFYETEDGITQSDLDYIYN